jgi:uncharacterized membrane protein
MSTEILVLGAILTALVVVLQMMGSFIRFGMFSISLVLVPIVIGASVGGAKLGAWLGGVFGIVVLISGDAAAFLPISVPGTIITVMVKGIACGLVAGLIYKWLSKYDRYASVVISALVCPVVNTGVFLLGCSVFFMDTIKTWALADYGENVVGYLFLGLAGVNFLVEVAINVLLTPAIVRLLDFRNKKKA